MKAELEAGPQLNADGILNILRQDRIGALVATELHGKYVEQAIKGNVYCAVSASGTLKSPGVTPTAAAPICLYNPPGSGKYLYLIRTHFLPTVTPGTQVTGAFAYYSANNPILSALTALTVNSTLIGANIKGVGLAYSAATVGTAPTILVPFATKFGTTNPTSTFPVRIIDDVDGQIVIAPGGFLTLQETSDDSTPNYAAIIAFVWEEVPI